MPIYISILQLISKKFARAHNESCGCVNLHHRRSVPEDLVNLSRQKHSLLNLCPRLPLVSVPSAMFGSTWGNQNQNQPQQPSAFGQPGAFGANPGTSSE
jgi:hypothetical protein